MFGSAQFVTVTVDQDLCWLSHENKWIWNILGFTLDNIPFPLCSHSIPNSDVTEGPMDTVASSITCTFVVVFLLCCNVPVNIFGDVETAI